MRPPPGFFGVEQLPVRTLLSEVLIFSVGDQVGAPSEILLLPRVKPVDVRIVSVHQGCARVPDMAKCTV